jgi:PadR family transcriptional regulator PadR
VLRVTRSVISVLEAMVVQPTTGWWGLDLARQCGLPTSTVYGVLARLEDAGLMDAAFEYGNPEELGRPLRRLYRLSPDGAIASRRMIRDWHDRHGHPRTLREAPA